MSHQAYVAFGSNLGDRNKNIQDAVSYLRACPKIRLKNISSIIETNPAGGPPQGKFLNGAIQIQTDLSVDELLKALQGIEIKLGRIRTVKFGPRIIDLDILFYDDKIIDTPNLKIPHPLLQSRQFMLAPLREIAPDFIHPALKKKIRDL